MTARELQFNQKIVMPDGKPTRDMVEIIQRLVRQLQDHESRLDTLDGGGP